MSQKKKRNKIKSPNQLQDVGKNPKQLQAKDEAKRFDPLARNLLFTDLVILALAQFMYTMEWIGDTVSGIATIFGVILLVVALAIQFGPKNTKPKPPRL